MHELIVIRHGESEQNVSNALLRQGDATMAKRLKNTCLSHGRLATNGVSQARLIGQFLLAEFPELGSGGGTHFLCSDMVRAMETAGNLDIPRALWESKTLLREASWGETEHCADPHVLQQHIHRQEFDDISSWSTPTGDRFMSTYIQVLNFLDYAHTLKGAVVAVTHGYYMRVLDMHLRHLTALHVSKPMKDVQYIHNCGVVHYTKREGDNDLSREFLHFRTTGKHTPQHFGKTRAITQKYLTSDRLLAACEKYPRYL